MPKWRGALLLAATALLFLVANRGAYSGYFHGDDLDNLAWTRELSIVDYLQALASPLFHTSNFRPVGHLFYFLMGPAAGLDFRWYIAVLQAFHLLNVWLLWLLLRRLGMSIFASGAGAALFAFHMAVFDAYWKPMYIFDVLCGAFCLLSLLLYTRNRLVLSFLSFWVAYKAKEVAVMLPLVFAAYELWLGGKRWKRLIPFFVVSLSFGLQGILRNPHNESADDYRLRLTPAALWTTATFYSSKVLLLPFAGLGLLALPLFFRCRRVWFGLASAGFLLVPMLLLPGRLFGAYLYVPLTGVAIAFAAIAEKRHWSVAAVFFAFWIPANYMVLRVNRRHTLAAADQSRRYADDLAAFLKLRPQAKSFVVDGAPAAMQRWGAVGAIRLLSPRRDLVICSAGDADAERIIASPPVAMLSWDQPSGKLYAAERTGGAPELSYIDISRAMPVWQLGEGWYQLEGRYRWSEPRATAWLHRPGSATHFELVVNIGPLQIHDLGKTSIQVLLGGSPLGKAEFTDHGWRTVVWEIPPGSPGPVEVEFVAGTQYHPSNGDPRTLGIPIAAFGFVRR